MHILIIDFYSLYTFPLFCPVVEAFIDVGRRMFLTSTCLIIFLRSNIYLHCVHFMASKICPMCTFHGFHLFRCGSISRAAEHGYVYNLHKTIMQSSHNGNSWQSFETSYTRSCFFGLPVISITYLSRSFPRYDSTSDLISDPTYNLIFNPKSNWDVIWYPIRSKSDVLLLFRSFLAHLHPDFKDCFRYLF